MKKLNLVILIAIGIGLMAIAFLAGFGTGRRGNPALLARNEAEKSWVSYLSTKRLIESRSDANLASQEVVRINKAAHDKLVAQGELVLVPNTIPWASWPLFFGELSKNRIEEYRYGTALAGGQWGGALFVEAKYKAKVLDIQRALEVKVP